MIQLAISIAVQYSPIKNHATPPSTRVQDVSLIRALNGSKLGFDENTRTMWHWSAPERIVHTDLSPLMKQHHETQRAASREEAAGLDSMSWLKEHQMHLCNARRVEQELTAPASRGGRLAIKQTQGTAERGEDKRLVVPEDAGEIGFELQIEGLKSEKKAQALVHNWQKESTSIIRVSTPIIRLSRSSLA